MIDRELRNWYVALSSSEKQIFLALVAHQLTIHGRAFGLDLSGSEQINAFKGLNELHHQTSSQIVSIGLNHDRYPDEVLLQMLSEKAAFYGLLAPLQNKSCDFARARAVWNKSNSSAT